MKSNDFIFNYSSLTACCFMAGLSAYLIDYTQSQKIGLVAMLVLYAIGVFGKETGKL